MTPQPVIVEPAASFNVLYLLDRYQLSRLPVIEVGSWLELLLVRISFAEADKLNFKTGQIGPRPVLLRGLSNAIPSVGRDGCCRWLIPKQLHHCCSWQLLLPAIATMNWSVCK